MNPPARARLPLALTLLAAALALALLLGVGLYGKVRDASDDAAAPGGRLPPAAVLPQTAPPAEHEIARVDMDDGVVHFYFAASSAELPEDAPQALAGVVRGVAAGQHAVISGFHDAAGSQARDAELAGERAAAVLGALAALGVDAEHMELRRLEEAESSGAEARRVDVWLE